MDEKKPRLRPQLAEPFNALGVLHGHDESYVAMGMEVAVERASGKIKVEPAALGRGYLASGVSDPADPRWLHSALWRMTD